VEMLIPFDQSPEANLGNQAGAKALNLYRLLQAGIRVPKTALVPGWVYTRYIEETGLKHDLSQALNRPLGRMRWEEIWDLSLRIRNRFLKTLSPPTLAEALYADILRAFGESPVALRSCSQNEDSKTRSHAGLHESFINVRGKDAILQHIRLVWASLWSDRALLYSAELGLDPSTSQMGVLVQEIVDGDRSGVMFTADPVNEQSTVIEAVFGLNQGLVDGTVEPEKATLDRTDGRLLDRTASAASQAVFLGENGVIRRDLSRERPTPILSDSLLSELYSLGMKIERLFGSPQDVEWTRAEESLVVLQSRPVTTRAGETSGERLWQLEDQRPWFLSLTRSFANLKDLRRRVEENYLPAMAEEAEAMAKTDLPAMSAEDLANEIKKRRDRYVAWKNIYWSEFIPLAHAVRLFGTAYNDAVHPDDPFEFMELLARNELLGVRRNRALQTLAEMIRADPALDHSLRSRNLPASGEFREAFDRFTADFGDLACSTAWCTEGPWGIIDILLELSKHQVPRPRDPASADDLEKRFLSRFEGEQRKFAEELLELGRTGYRLRDDDNIYLGKIAARLQEAVDEGRERVCRGECDLELPEDIAVELVSPGSISPEARDQAPNSDHRPFELEGHPAGPGIAHGRARVVRGPQDLFSFKRNEVLVCDALDPNMTFVVPLASAVVERRGGMLIHGAIIAREYGLPCVTGVTDATGRIRTGDRLTVDGFTGRVIRQR